MNYSWYDTLGLLGVVLVLGTYVMLQTNKVTANDLSFSLGNGGGALLILVSLSQDFNLSAFLIEAAWLLISIFGFFRVLYERRNRRT